MRCIVDTDLSPEGREGKGGEERIERVGVIRVRVVLSYSFESSRAADSGGTYLQWSSLYAMPVRLLSHTERCHTIQHTHTTHAELHTDNTPAHPTLHLSHTKSLHFFTHLLPKQLRGRCRDLRHWLVLPLHRSPLSVRMWCHEDLPSCTHRLLLL